MGARFLTPNPREVHIEPKTVGTRCTRGSHRPPGGLLQLKREGSEQRKFWERLGLFVVERSLGIGGEWRHVQQRSEQRL
jgi:hypothetical protein